MEIESRGKLPTRWLRLIYCEWSAMRTAESTQPKYPCEFMSSTWKHLLQFSSATGDSHFCRAFPGQQMADNGGGLFNSCRSVSGEMVLRGRPIPRNASTDSGLGEGRAITFPAKKKGEFPRQKISPRELKILDQTFTDNNSVNYWKLSLEFSELSCFISEEWKPPLPTCNRTGKATRIFSHYIETFQDGVILHG